MDILRTSAGSKELKAQEEVNRLTFVSIYRLKTERE